MNLKPCPFCGGTAAYDNADDRSGGKWFACTDCGARMWSPYGISTEVLAERWNKRTPPEERQTILEEAANACVWWKGGGARLDVALSRDYERGCYDCAERIRSLKRSEPQRGER